MISLLIVIAVLIGFVIALLPQPDRGGDSLQIARQTEDGDRPGDAPRPAAGGDGEDQGVDRGVPQESTETYPAEEERLSENDASRRDEALWWLPQTQTPPSEWGTLYLVLDDAGRSLDELRTFLELPYRMTIAVLPLRDYSIESALAVAASGNEVLLHLPMEPVGSADPGHGAVLVEMSGRHIRRTLLANLESVPGAVGVNNHMGSRATQDDALMGEVLSTLQDEGLFFLDSRTSAQSVARSVATRLAVPFAERHVFLDNVRERGAILESIRLALERVHSGESVVMIGHVTAPVLADTLREIHPLLAERGYYFGPISKAASVPRVAEDAE